MFCSNSNILAVVGILSICAGNPSFRVSAVDTFSSNSNILSAVGIPSVCACSPSFKVNSVHQLTAS